MNSNNYLDILSSNRNKFVYRIIPVVRLFELFANKRNVLVKPHKWEDPFENFVLRSEQIYGQCWTFQTTSDAMWRIYSPNYGAVRIRSTVLKLADSLFRDRGNMAQDEVFIGRVKYLRNNKLMSFAKNIFQKSTIPSARTLAQTLLVKRPAFRHEREVRLILISSDKSIMTSDIYSYCVDPNSLIDQIMIDPRTPEKEVSKLKQKIKSETNFSGAIKRSLLYAPPPDFSEEIQKLQGTM